MFGTQDSQEGANLSKAATFALEYEKLVVAYASLPTKPRIFICLPPPMLRNGNTGITDENLEAKIMPKVKRVAKDLDLLLIDTNATLKARPELFSSDNIHVGRRQGDLIGHTVYKALTGDDKTTAIIHAAWITDAPATRP